MQKISYRLIYNRKKKLNHRGTALIQIEAYLKGKKIYFSTHIYISPKQWNQKKEQIINHPNAEALNMMLRVFLMDLERKEVELWCNREEISLAKLKECFYIETRLSFLNFVKNEIETVFIKSSTRKNRFTTYKLLNAFNPNLTFHDITSKFVFEFESFLYSRHLSTNTVAKHMRHLKLFVNAAINKDYLHPDEYPFRRYRIKSVPTQHTYLTPEEVVKLENLANTNLSEPLEHCLNAFLFCCYTGLRYSDFRNMSDKNIVKIDGKPWVIFRTIKTNTEIKLPIDLLFDGKAWKMIKKYHSRLDKFFNVLPNSLLNKKLIKIGELAGINKHFSFHTARHTNATLLIYNGASITTVQKLLGHRDLSTTQIYSEIMERTIVKDLNKCSKPKRVFMQ